ncbi:MAG TPA: hypothetical protein VNU49_06110 [Opitutaceae bacterium]|nr:hypothetical protein [Opitutaceae bacterium]
MLLPARVRVLLMVCRLELAFVIEFPLPIVKAFPLITKAPAPALNVKLPLVKPTISLLGPFKRVVPAKVRLSPLATAAFQLVASLQRKSAPAPLHVRVAASSFEQQSNAATKTPFTNTELVEADDKCRTWRVRLERMGVCGAEPTQS